MGSEPSSCEQQSYVGIAICISSEWLAAGKQSHRPPGRTREETLNQEKRRVPINRKQTGGKEQRKASSRLACNKEIGPKASKKAEARTERGARGQQEGPKPEY